MPDEQRMELTPIHKWRRTHTETEGPSSSTSAESASTREVTRVQSEQAHRYTWRGRRPRKLLRNKTRKWCGHKGTRRQPGESRKSGCGECGCSIVLKYFV